MTDISEQAPAADGGSATPTRAKRASLNTMLLSELQQLAGGMGIATAKLKKSDLVAAIKAAQAGGTAPSAKTRAPKTASPDEAAAARTDERANGRNEAKSDTTKAPDTASADTKSPDTSIGGSPAEPKAEQRERQRGNDSRNGATQGGARNGNQSSQRDREPNSQGQGGSQNNRQGNDSTVQTNNQDGQNTSQNGNQNTGNRDDDDYEGGRRRRGRRYRDRRGRNRERRRPAGWQTNTDVEPTVSDDDVLIPVAGILDEVADKNTWFVRTGGYYASPDDVYVANSYVRRYGLRRGDAVTGAIKQPKDGDRREKYNPLVRLDTVNGRNPDELKNRIEFTRLTPLYPQERLRLETEPHILTTRVIDLVMPIGKGQRALIVSPPKAGKTMMHAVDRERDLRPTTRNATSWWCSSTSVPKRSPTCSVR